MPVPRRFDRKPPERDPTRINERIRVAEVRLVDEDGSQIGVVKTEEAMRMATERDLDLVEVAPDSRPPVARLLDYSKYKYEQEQKAKAARKHQQQVNVREIKLRPKIADHDYATKRGHVQRFLNHGDKVKVTIMFRGREQAHPERGRALLERLFTDLGELAVIEQHPQQEGRNMHMMLAPSPATLAKVRAERTQAAGPSDEPAQEGAAPAESGNDQPAQDDAPAAESGNDQPAQEDAPAAESGNDQPAQEARAAAES